MRRIGAWALALLVSTALLTACAAGPRAVTYTAYQLTCCPAADVDRLWQPGTTVDLHWIVQTASTTGVNPTHKVVIDSALMGPYSDVTTLKQATGATHTVQGSIITMDDRSAPPTSEISTFLLPADLPAGYYNLNINWDFGHGNSASASSVVRVGAH